jgi:hypothetical protein
MSVTLSRTVTLRQRKWWMGAIAVAALSAEIVSAAAGTASNWSLGGLNASPAATIAAWAAALVLAVATLAAVTRKGWFHPLSLPLATLAVMSLGAPLWVYFTHQAVGLLYDTGHQPALASARAVAVSVSG